MKGINTFRLSMLAVASVLVVLSGCAAQQVTNFGQNEHFSASQAVSGTTSTPEQCAQINNAVWVTSGKDSACLKYYASPSLVKGQASHVIVFMGGDILANSHGMTIAESSYAERTPAHEQKYSNDEHKHDGILFIQLARPGVLGSSGDQNKRRTAYEIGLVNAFFDKIKEMYDIQAFGVFGQSGGGGLTGALADERHDILCAVPSSGVTAVVARASEKGKYVDATGTSFNEVWDPIDHVKDSQPMQGFRLFAVSSVEDANVPAASQQMYVAAAKHAGWDAHQILVHGNKAEHHQTGAIGSRVLQSCMNGMPTEEIIQEFSGMSNGDKAGLLKASHVANAYLKAHPR